MTTVAKHYTILSFIKYLTKIKKTLSVFWVRPLTILNKAPRQKPRGLFGAGGGGRTRTLSPGPDFESGTSANSITPAWSCDATYYTITSFQNQVLFKIYIKLFLYAS